MASFADKRSKDEARMKQGNMSETSEKTKILQMPLKKAVTAMKLERSKLEKKITNG